MQVLIPRLEIRNRAFVMPAALSNEGSSIRPDEIVAKERWRQSISAVLTVSGALALAYRYRHAFRKRA
jgi:hypothetical protein